MTGFQAAQVSLFPINENEILLSKRNYTVSFQHVYHEHFKKARSHLSKGPCRKAN